MAPLRMLRLLQLQARQQMPLRLLPLSQPPRSRQCRYKLHWSQLVSPLPLHQHLQQHLRQPHLLTALRQHLLHLLLPLLPQHPQR